MSAPDASGATGERFMNQMSEIDEAYCRLNVRANKIYDFVILYHNYMYAQHKYENVNCNMMEIHTLTLIDDNPGITSTQLAKLWHKSKGAISQTVKKLMQSGWVEKRYKENNEKTALLYVTESGRRLSGIHKAYDVADITQTTAYLVQQCSAEDLDAFYRILDEYIKLMKSEL